MTSVNNTNRNAAIEALRFFSILQIAVWHFGKYFMNAGFLGVEFFLSLPAFFNIKMPLSPLRPVSLFILSTRHESFILNI